LNDIVAKSPLPFTFVAERSVSDISGIMLAFQGATRNRVEPALFRNGPSVGLPVKFKTVGSHFIATFQLQSLVTFTTCNVNVKFLPMPIVDDGPVIDDGCRLSVVEAEVAWTPDILVNDATERHTKIANTKIANTDIFLFIFFSSIFYMQGAFSC
jgi:hypothetical protein